MPEALALLRDNNLLALRLWLALASTRVLAPALLLDTARVQHGALELRGLVHRLRHVAGPVERE